MPDSPEPTEWFENHFGDHSLDVMKALVAAGQSAHDRSLDAKAGSKLKSNDAYGSSFWLSLPEEIVAGLAFLPGAEIQKPQRSRYELIVFNGIVIFAAKCPGDSSGPDDIKLRPSRLRRDLFSLETRATADDPLDFGDFDFETDEAGAHFVPGLGSASGLILVAYDCTARAGLQRVYVGDANLLEDGTVVWLYQEELPVHVLSDESTVLTLLADQPAPRFDDAPLPPTTLGLRVREETPEADELVGKDVEHIRTDANDHG